MPTCRLYAQALAGDVIPPFCRLKWNRNGKYVQGFLPRGQSLHGQKSIKVSFSGKTAWTRITEWEARIKVQIFLWEWARLNEEGLLVGLRQGYYVYP